jgi:hypothetical protein
MKKTRSKKSREIVPLKNVYNNIVAPAVKREQCFLGCHNFQHAGFDV